MITSKAQIWVTFQRKGIHFYPQAATDPALADVSYLGHKHRHLFKTKVWIDVHHDDRELEFHQFLNWLESLYDNNVLSFDHKSCEMISNDLAEHIHAKFPGRNFAIDISEDGEVGSYTQYNVQE